MREWSAAGRAVGEQNVAERTGVFRNGCVATRRGFSECRFAISLARVKVR
jgi:hypothetical protein